MAKELTIAERASKALSIEHTEDQLSELADKFTDVTEIKDDTDYELVKRGALELRDVRISIEKAGKGARDDANAFSKAVIAEQKRLVGIIGGEEERLKALRKEVDDREARIEEEKRQAEEKRIQLLVERITFINQQVEGLLLAPPSEIQERIDWLLQHACLDTFEEYTEQALAANSKAMECLNEALRVANELEAQKAEQGRVAAEQAEQQRKLDEQAAAQRKEQEAIDRKKREEEEQKLAAERAEAEKVRQEKEALETKQREADEQQRRKEEMEAEAARQEAMRPDFEKLEAWASEIRFMEGPDVKGDECQQLINEALRGLGAVSNKLFAGTKKAKAA